MHILITGGTGFVGQHLARSLLEQGHRVRLMGRDFAPAANLLARGAEPLRVDLRDHAAVVAACAGAEAVYHVGAKSEPWGKREAFYATNVGGTAAVVEGCRVHRVRRLVYVSSPSVLFDGRDQHTITDDAPYPRRFASVYSWTKKLGEDLVRASGVEAVILRPKAVFGSGDRALLPRIVRAARANRLPQIGNGENLVDLTYIENVVHALVLALNAPRAAGGTYTITNNQHVKLWEVIRHVLRANGLRDRLRPVPLRLALLAAAGMEARAAVTGGEPLLTRYTAAILGRTQTYNIAAAQHDLGYQPLVSVEEGIEQTLRVGMKDEG